jgi:hypothetical protein
MWKHSGRNDAALDSLGPRANEASDEVEFQRPVKRAPSVLAEMFFLRIAGGKVMSRKNTSPPARWPGDLPRTLRTHIRSNTSVSGRPPALPGWVRP